MLLGPENYKVPNPKDNKESKHPKHAWETQRNQSKGNRKQRG